MINTVTLHIFIDNGNKKKFHLLFRDKNLPMFQDINIIASIILPDLVVVSSVLIFGIAFFLSSVSSVSDVWWNLSIPEKKIRLVGTAYKIGTL